MARAEKNILSQTEVMVLNFLGTTVTRAGEVEPTAITDISSSTGVKDRDEVLRALYTLEGRRLVQPDPEWDFTSSRWKITEVGLRAVQVLGL
jgi:hypothetical protein